MGNETVTVSAPAANTATTKPPRWFMWFNYFGPLVLAIFAGAAFVNWLVMGWPFSVAAVWLAVILPCAGWAFAARFGFWLATKGSQSA